MEFLNFIASWIISNIYEPIALLIINNVFTPLIDLGVNLTVSLISAGALTVGMMILWQVLFNEDFNQ